jgi:dienelactone hydrolase
MKARRSFARFAPAPARIALFALAALAAAPQAHAASSVPVNVTEAGKEYKGTLFVPSKPAAGPLPLVLVVQEWWGKTAYPDKRAAQIADELGYAALSVDMYGDGKTAETPAEAQALATPFYKNPEMGVKRLQAFAAAAPGAAKLAQVTLDASKTAAIGYCFGGAQVLNLARDGHLPAGETLAAVVSFHGGLASSLKAQPPILPKLLVLHGAADKLVKPEEVKAFKQEMKKDKAKMEFVAYPGAMHAFTNPEATEKGKRYGIPVAYNEAADKASWAKMKKFLKGVFGG